MDGVRGYEDEMGGMRWEDEMGDSMLRALCHKI